VDSSFKSGFLAGLLPGLAAAGLVFFLMRSAADPVRVPASSGPVPSADDASSLKEENRRLKEKVAELQRPAKPAPPVESNESKPVESAADYRDQFAKLTELGLTAFGSPKYGEAVQAIKAAGRPAVDFLMNSLRTSSSATERFLAAALLEGSGDAAGIPALAETLKKDPDVIVRRMASHAIAVLGSEAADAPLRAASTADADWGVRLNSAYGLAKRNDDEGLRILREGYESSSTPAEYRIGILGGLADVAAPSTAPLFRQILADTKDASYLLLSMTALAKMKDVASIPALERIQGSTEPDMVKQAAAKAIEAIRK